MLGRALLLPDLVYEPPLSQPQPSMQYACEIKEGLERAHQLLRQTQLQAYRKTICLNHDCARETDLFLMDNRRRRKGENPKLQTK